jgi:SAM-dependent methyltransferase
MSEELRFKQRYQSTEWLRRHPPGGDTPWDIGKPDFNLIQTVAATPIKPCKALEIGCGTGDNAIWLAQQNFQVVGIDASEVAIEKAKSKAGESNVKCDFIVSDIMTSRIEGAPFGFAFDRGCFHTLDSDQERRRFAEIVHGYLGADSLWLSLIGNADEQREEPGPPQLTASDIVNATEPCFEILSLVSGSFGANRPQPPRAWVCLMRRRR